MNNRFRSKYDWLHSKTPMLIQKLKDHTKAKHGTNYVKVEGQLNREEIVQYDPLAREGMS